MPPSVTLLINEDDPTLPDYRAELPAGWKIDLWPAGFRIADIYRGLVDRFPNESFYGLFCDDNEPQTPGWHEILALAAEDRYVAIANGDASYPKVRNAAVFGAALGRAMGSLVPAGFRHNYMDDAWDLLLGDLNLLRPCDGVIVRHRHPLIDPTIPTDATYTRGSSDIAEDALVWRKYLIGGERWNFAARVAAALNIPFQPTKPRLAIGTPAHDGKVSLEYARSLAATMSYMTSNGVGVDLVMIPGESILAKARNSIVELFLRNRATHLLFIDADMGWDREAPLELMQKGKDLVAGVGRRKIDDKQYCVQFEADRVDTDETGCAPALRVGTGFMMISRACLLRMIDGHPQTLYRDWQSGEWMNALFDTIIRDGEFWSEDYTFCDRWKAIGGEVWIDPGIRLSHIGTKNYVGCLADEFTPLQPEGLLEAAE